MKLVIERKLWSRKHVGNKLFDGEKYCIMGFLGKALGIPDERMLGKWNLGDFVHEFPALKWLYKETSWGKGKQMNQTILMILNEDTPLRPESEVVKFLKAAKFEVILK